MKPEEAIQQIIDNDCSRYCRGDDALVCSECRWSVAIDALKKQITVPKLWEGDGYADGVMVYDTWYCQNCGAGYEETEDYRYCPNCGQAIEQEK